MKTLLFYTHALTGGGAERVLAVLASGYARRGERVLFVTDYESKDNLGFLDEKVERVIVGRGLFGSTRALSKILKAEKPDISISALSGQNLKHAIAAWFAGRNAHAVLSYHGFFQAEPRPLSRLSYLLTPLLSRITAKTVCVSDALRRHVVGQWLGKKENCVRIYNPVLAGCPNAKPATREEINARAPVILASGRLIESKGFSMLLKAFALVKPANARLVIIGEGEERGNLEAEIKRLGLTNRVDLPGYIADPWNHYRDAACVAITSTHESFSLVAVEALAHGLPVVSTWCQGPPEILEFGRWGALVGIDDVGATASALTQALENRGDPQPRFDYAKKFSIEHGMEEYDRLFEAVLDAEAKTAMATPKLQHQPQ